jgi:hypothetical protein
VVFSDIKASAFKEEELLKNDMRYASGVDDFSMGVGGGASSATEVRHLRESTLERVRLYVNHLGDAYSKVLRHWICMWRQFMTADMTIRIIGEDGRELFPLIEKDDLRGEFDYRASVIPSIAGKNDIDKKQGMDLFQVLVNLPFIDPRKLTSKVLHSWNWSLDSISKPEDQQMPGMEGMEGQPGLPGQPGQEEMAAMMGGQPPEGMMPEAGGSPLPQLNGSGEISPDIMKQALALLAGSGGGSNPQMDPSQFADAKMPINLMQQGGLPPTVKGVGQTSNPRGLNRTGKVNTNIPTKAPNGPGAQLLNQAANTQR